MKSHLNIEVTLGKLDRINTLFLRLPSELREGEREREREREKLSLLHGNQVTGPLASRLNPTPSGRQEVMNTIAVMVAVFWRDL
jgi:hypothetical protein